MRASDVRITNAREPPVFWLGSQFSVENNGGIATLITALSHKPIAVFLLSANVSSGSPTLFIPITNVREGEGGWGGLTRFYPALRGCGGRGFREDQ